MKSRRSVAYVSLLDASFISILKKAVQIAPKIWDSNQIYTKNWRAYISVSILAITRTLYCAKGINQITAYTNYQVIPSISSVQKPVM